MARRRKRPNRQAGLPKPWTPMRSHPVNPKLLEALRQVGENPDGVRYQAWANDKYDALVRHFPNGITHISLKRINRRVVRDWRDLQRIKNDVLGPEREACEIFPAESRLADSANEYHLWALPVGHRFPFGFNERFVQDSDETNTHRVAGQSKARQRPLR